MVGKYQDCGFTILNFQIKNYMGMANQLSNTFIIGMTIPLEYVLKLISIYFNTTFNPRLTDVTQLTKGGPLRFSKWTPVWCSFCYQWLESPLNIDTKISTNMRSVCLLWRHKDVRLSKIKKFGFLYNRKKWILAKNFTKNPFWLGFFAKIWKIMVNYT